MLARYPIPRRPVSVAIVLVLCCAAGAARQAAAQPVPAAQPGVAWIYKDVPPQGAADPRSATERYFEPTDFWPAAETGNIVLNLAQPDPAGEGTCVLLAFKITSPTAFLGVNWKPIAKPGNPPAALDLTKYLTVGFGRPLVLKFRARCSRPNDKARVDFMVGGIQVAMLRDGILFPLPENPTVTLTDAWQTFTIDLTEDAAGVSSLVGPLRVVVKAPDNPGAKVVSILVDDVRFEVR